MKLYYKPGACSLASHIVLNELGADFELEKVDTATKRTESGADFLEVNPNGYVPALELKSGDILIEGASILQYLADQTPSSTLAPANGTLERARLQQHLNFVASELHKAFGPFFSGRDLSAEEREVAVANVGKKLSNFENILSDGRNYLLGGDFSVADAYLFVVTNWTNFVGIDLGTWPNVQAFLKRAAARPAVQASLKAEGLLN
ncbi:glutathione transferase GstA [Alphaproteobacteria bacterium 46_93_T64]|nr:glutathione transferase GstA [Alphaproteobacteria bacterium 46_93_T64]